MGRFGHRNEIMEKPSFDQRVETFVSRTIDFLSFGYLGLELLGCLFWVVISLGGMVVAFVRSWWF